MPLVVSLSGIGIRALDRCADFAAELDRRQVPLSLLVAPRPAEDSRPHEQVLSWVRSRAASGDAVSLHGFDHAPTPSSMPLRLARTPRRPSAALRGAEFAALPAHEAGLRLAAARAVLDRLDLRTGTFVPPRWLASPGTVTALARHGFEVCADAMTVRDLRSGRVHRCRLHALGPGHRAEPWWCRALLLGVGRAARRQRAIRLAVDAADLDRPGPRQAVLDSVELALHHGARPVTYGSFPAFGEG
ncbi:DUF2334 domain-containing protein [Parasphingorhabdus pacifica]